jgi:hypothetical protein
MTDLFHARSSALFRCVSRHRRCTRKYTYRYGIPSKQNPRTMEACFWVGDFSRFEVWVGWSVFSSSTPRGIFPGSERVRCKYSFQFLAIWTVYFELTLSSANILIIIIVSSFSAYFVRENRIARAGEKVIQGLKGFLYTL